MKMTSKAVTAAVLMLTALGPAWSQTAVAPPSGQKTLAATMNVYAFPSAGQTATQQSKDESACYEWAVSNVGTDPFALQTQSAEQAQQAAAAQQQAAQAGKGTAVKGAVGGAAAGALVGEIGSGDAGRGAAYGAAAGLLGGALRGKSKEKQATEQAQAQAQQTQQATQAQLDNFKKAFSACLESKKYLVKY